MSLERFNNDALTKQEKVMVRMRSLTNYVMGLLLTACGIMIFFPPKIIADKIALYDEVAIKLLGTICIIYGLFRIYRGYKKNYFRES